MSAEKRNWVPFQGGKSLQMVGFGLGVAGLALTAARAFLGADGARVALHAYIIAYAYFLGLALAALVLLGIWHASRGKWMVAIRRPVEIIAATMPLFVVLFVPILAGMKLLYPWAWGENVPVGAPAFTEEDRYLIHHRHGWINPGMFTGRAVLYFAVWILFAWVITRASFKQDERPDPTLTERMWKWGAASLPFVAIGLAFAAFDWLMSLATVWFSSMWGVYYFAGSIVSLFAVLLLVYRSLSSDPSFKGAMRVTHWLSTGQFLLAFTAFWGYIAFDQYMLTFVANLADATPFFITRQTASWRYVAYALMFGHFAVPFIILLSRRIKVQPDKIRWVAIWILFIHFVDLYWCVMPQVNPTWAIPDWSNIAAFFGVGGLSVGVAVTIFRGKYAVPVNDPFLAESLEYSIITAGTNYTYDDSAHDVDDAEAAAGSH